jgi:hypothetical protein
LVEGNGPVNGRAQKKAAISSKVIIYHEGASPTLARTSKSVPRRLPDDRTTDPSMVLLSSFHVDQPRDSAVAFALWRLN